MSPFYLYNICVAAAVYNELQALKSSTDKANSDLLKTYGTSAALLGPGAAIKYGLRGSAITSAGLFQTYLAATFVKGYMLAPAFASGVFDAENQYKKDVKACGGK